jgi:hypothetical protein
VSSELRADPSVPMIGVEMQERDSHHPLNVRKAAIRTASLGIAHAILLLSAVWLLKSKTPGLNASDERIVSFYSDAGNRRIVIAAGLYLLPFAGIAFIWFIAALRMWVTASAPRENVLLSNVQLISGVIYTTLLFAGGASESVLAASTELTDSAVDPLIARQFPQFGSALLVMFAMRTAAMFVLTTSNLGRTTGILPRWFTIIGFVVALVLLLTASLNAWLMVVFPAWILVFSSILLNRAMRIPRGLNLSDDMVTASQRSSRTSSQNG